MANTDYVIITAARNEELYIENLLLSVVQQTVPPKRWVIVSDGSTDKTDAIISKYCKQYDFIKLVTNNGDPTRNFGSQVRAIQAGIIHLKGLEYEYLGNLDADVSFGPDYFEKLLRYFVDNATLGLAGGSIYENDGKRFVPRKFNSNRSVAHAVQLFRKRLYEDIGGYRALKYGGPDTLAVAMARMSGWEVASFPDLVVLHHRPTTSAEGFIKGAFRSGRMDYSLGNHPFFELLFCLRRVRHKPIAIYALSRLAGFIYSSLKSDDRDIDDSIIYFIRNEQMNKILAFFRLGTI